MSSPESERPVERPAGLVTIREDGEFAYVDAPFGRVRVFVDGTTLVAVIETPAGKHVVSTFAEAEEIERAEQAR